MPSKRQRLNQKGYFFGYFDKTPNTILESIPDSIPDCKTIFSPTITEPSTAKVTKKVKGIYSDDPKVDKDPSELWRFMVSNLRKPRLLVYIAGKKVASPSTGLHHWNTDIDSTTDFAFFIDISALVSPDCDRIVAKPSGATVRTVVEEYTRSRNPFKEVGMRKGVVGWDWDGVRKRVTKMVRQAGYEERVEVEFLTLDDEVVAMASNGFMRATQSMVMRGICVVSCLWVACWPAWALARKRSKHHRLSCEYEMAVNADTFLANNSAMVRAAVMLRKRQKLLYASTDSNPREAQANESESITLELQK